MHAVSDERSENDCMDDNVLLQEPPPVPDIPPQIKTPGEDFYNIPPLPETCPPTSDGSLTNSEPDSDSVSSPPPVQSRPKKPFVYLLDLMISSYNHVFFCVSGA